MVCCEGWERPVPSEGAEGLRDGGRSLSLCTGFLEKGFPNYCCLVPASTADGPQCCRRQPASLLHPSLPAGGNFGGLSWFYQLRPPLDVDSRTRMLVRLTAGLGHRFPRHKPLPAAPRGRASTRESGSSATAVFQH